MFGALDSKLCFPFILAQIHLHAHIFRSAPVEFVRQYTYANIILLILQTYKRLELSN